MKRKKKCGSPNGPVIGIAAPDVASWHHHQSSGGGGQGAGVALQQLQNPQADALCGLLTSTVISRVHRLTLKYIPDSLS